MSRTRIVLAAVALITLAAGTASAQSPTVNSSISAVANVAPALSISGTNLDFGDVFQGIPKTVGTADASAGTRAAGRFQIVGTANAQVQVTWGTMPTNLLSGANNLPVGSYTGCRNGIADGSSSNGCTAMTVASAAQSAATLSGTGYLYLFVGGTVTPSTTQAAGTYSNTIAVTVAYTGN